MERRQSGRAIKAGIARNIGPTITCSIGFAANRHLAKIACKMDKPDGLTVWRPEDMPAPLLAVPLEDIPGVGGRMAARLAAAGIQTTEQLYATQPKQMRALWRNVTGERLWYALHGYSIEAPEVRRGSFPDSARDSRSEIRATPLSRSGRGTRQVQAARVRRRDADGDDTLRRDQRVCRGNRMIRIEFTTTPWAER